MHLIRDLLDKEVVDRHGREMGRVDSVILELDSKRPPRVAAIELGPAVLAHRVWAPLGRWVAGLEYALGMAEGRPLRIPYSGILSVTNHVKVDVAAGETVAGVVESRLRRAIGGIPEL